MKSRIIVIGIMAVVMFLIGIDISLSLWVISIFCMFFITNYAVKQGNVIASVVSYAISIGCCAASLVYDYNVRLLYIFIIFSVLAFAEAFWNRAKSKA